MPNETEIERRNRALVAFAILSGARDKAIISFRLKHIDIERGLIEQDSREVRTKRAKTFTTWFFPVGDDIRQNVVDWVAFLREEKGFGPDDPLFPKTKVAPGDDHAFRVASLDRAPWANANPVRDLFREACAQAGLPYFNPHLFRNTLVQVAYDRKLDAEAFKAWSQNLGHESCLTTFSSYGTIPPARQAEIIRRLADHSPASDAQSTAEMLRRLAQKVERNERVDWYDRLAQLQTLELAPGTNLTDFDLFGFNANILADAAAHGFTNTTDPCYAFTGLPTSTASNTGCDTGNIDSFVYWNDIHPTAPVQALWAQGLRAAVPEPSTWAMLLIGFSGLAFAGYRRARESRAA
jgi:hypothetical protein